MATLNDDDIVISGISGKFPESDSVEELWENLINHTDMITDNDRLWKTGSLFPNNDVGKLKDITQFDAEYFAKGNITPVFAPLPLKLLFERVAEAIIDSGRPLQDLSNTQTALYVAASNSTEHDPIKLQFGNEFPSFLHISGFMGPNSISQFFNLKGQSISVNTSFSSALFALRCAMDSLQKGESQYAIVGCSQLLLCHMNFNVLDKIGVLTHDSKCYPFDEAANGYNRSDAVVACFLEKAKTAKRAYCTVMNCSLNSNGYSFKGIFTPVPEMQEMLYEDTLKGCKEISHLDVTYVEANAVGIKTSDSAEISSLSKVYCKNRQEPLLVGSVKSNLGHAEIAAGMCSLTKAILIMEKGIIPGNLRFRKPNSKIPALHNGEIKIVSENMPWEGGLIAVNCFGLGGTNGHLILRPNLKEPTTTECEKKRKLFAFTSRTKEGLEVMLDYLEKNPDPNLYGLLGNIMDNPNPNMFWKGYTILNADKPVRKIELDKNEKRPVCFVYTGFGCQWTGMGKDLMEIEFFREVFVKCFDCLKPFGVDIEYLMENESSCNLNTMSWQSLTILTAIQITFTEMLRTLEINPDYIIGYSVGETACAYADGCITMEQTMLLTYQKALEILENCPRGGMMAVASLSPEKAIENVPEGVAVACHNSEDSVTLAGEADALTKYMQQLRQNNVMVKKMESQGFAFHCKLFDHSGYNYLTELKKIIPSPKRRSSKWISTSVPEKDWDTDKAKTLSPEYLMNNFFEPVLFYEGLQHIPKNAIFIEIGPHNLLTPLLKRNAGADAKYLAFMKKNADNINVMLTNIGEMYLAGLNPQISKLYPYANFPVPRGTPMISPLLRWDHSNRVKYTTIETAVDCKIEAIYAINKLKGIFGKLTDHNINGQTFFPVSGYILIAWRKLALVKLAEFDETPVVLENVEILKNVVLKNPGDDFLKISFLKVSKRFEIYHNDEICVTGFIRLPELNAEYAELDLPDADANKGMISKDDIYKEFGFRGYNYGEDFQGLLNVNANCTAGKIKWNNNWVQFLESMFQLQNLNHNSLDAFAFNGIEYLYIDPIKHREHINTSTEISVKFDPQLRHTQAGGFILRGTSATKISQSECREQIVLDQLVIDPLFNDRCPADTSQLAEDLQQYKTCCETYLIQILKGLKNFQSDLLLKCSKTNPQGDFDSIKLLAERFLGKSEYKSQLLEQLMYILEISDYPNVQFLTFVFNNEEEGDFLLTAFMSDFILRASLDIALENIKTSSVNIVQISSHNVWLTKQLTTFFQTCTDIKINYTVAESESWENEVFENLDKELMDWDVESSSLINSKIDIIISYHQLLGNKSILKSTLNKFRNALKVGGFVLVIEAKEDNIIGHLLHDFLNSSCSQNDLLEAFRAENFEIVAQKSDAMLHDVYLLRKVSETHFPITSITIGDNNIGHWLSEVQNTLANFQNKKIKGNIWLLSRDAPTSGVIGIVKNLAKESGDRIRCLFKNKKDGSQSFTKEDIPKNVIKKDLLINIFQNEQWSSLRNISVKKDVKVPLQKIVLNIRNPGDYESLYWTEADQQLNPEHPETYVYFAGLCNRDILSAERHQSFRDSHGMPHFGYDFSGRNPTGDKIMGITSYSAVATCIPYETKYTWKIPQHWTLAEAATVPFAYILVYYAFLVRGHLRNGEKVLIHCATEAEGQAAINIALSMFCDIYVTVGSQERRSFLRKEYPVLNERNIFSSTDIDFEFQVLKATKGKGVDVVLNSFTDERMIASLKCLKENGRFLNISNSRIPAGRNLDGAIRQKKYIDIDFEFLFKSNDHFTEVEKKFSYGLKTEVVKPIKSVVFEKDQIVDAFLLMKNQDHIGKVIVKVLEEENTNLKSQPKLPFVAAVPRIQFHCNNTIIVAGALSGFGMMLTRWIACRGARNLILNSTTGRVNGYQERCIHILRLSGINVHINNDNLADERSAESLVEKANKIGPVIGIFNSSMVEEDDPKGNKAAEMLKGITDNEIKATRNLDKVSRHLCPHLKYFVIFSSVGAGDSGTRKSLAYGNAAMEKICQTRQDSGVPGLAIQLGWSGDRRSDHKTSGNEVDKSQFISQTLHSCVSVMDTLLNQRTAILSCYSLAEKNNEKEKIMAEDYVGPY